MKRIALLVIATGKYDQFAQPLYESACKHLFVNDEDVKLDFILFKSTKNKVLSSRYSKQMNFVNEIVIEHKPWPNVTLERFKTFWNNRIVIEKYDYLFYVDVDALFIKDISINDFNLEKDKLVFVHHCGFANGGWGSTNVDPNSKAYFDYTNAKYPYCMGGFYGGSKAAFMIMSYQLDINIRKDKDINVMAEWHDESHMNKFINSEVFLNIKIMPPTFFMAEEMEGAHEKASILALKKDHVSLRS